MCHNKETGNKEHTHGSLTLNLFHFCPGGLLTNKYPSLIVSISTLVLPFVSDASDASVARDKEIQSSDCLKKKFQGSCSGANMTGMSEHTYTHCYISAHPSSMPLKSADSTGSEKECSIDASPHQLHT